MQHNYDELLESIAKSKRMMNIPNIENKFVKINSYASVLTF